MPYFNHDKTEPVNHRQVFQHPGEDGDWMQEPQDDYDDDSPEEDEFPLPPDEDDDYDLDDELTDEERREMRKGRFRVAAGVFDFFSVIAGTVVVLLLIALLVSLVTWLQADIDQTFTLMTRQ